MKVHAPVTRVTPLETGVVGQILMPFVEEPPPYIPAVGQMRAAGGTSVDPKKKKPAAIREMAENLNKQLRESGNQLRGSGRSLCCPSKRVLTQ